jgi:ABC-type branched-subunit amino acid transport system substrate-binding protein
MTQDQSELNAGRQEIFCLFAKLCEHQTRAPWSFLPILSLVGPTGHGKSVLIRDLYFRHSNISAFPHTILDFEERNAPHDLLAILGRLRNDLRHQRDARGRTLAFPRFDIIYDRLKNSQSQEGEAMDETKKMFKEFRSVMREELSDLLNVVSAIHFLVGIVFYLLKFLFRLPLLRVFLNWLIEREYLRAGQKPQWRWYQDQVRRFEELNLPEDADVIRIRRRLNEMCIMGEPERRFLIEQILPKAFLADLRYGTSDNDSSMLNNGPPYVVIFLDSFEVLQRSSESTARQLLEVLALNDYRKRGDSDPLLLIVASEKRLPDMSRAQFNRHFLPNWHGNHFQERADALYQHWTQQLPPPGNRQALRLKDLYLPLPLSIFTLKATRDYLLQLDKRCETDVFTNEALIEDIHRATQGYPIFVKQVAEALQASLQNPRSGIRDTASLFASEEGKEIVDRLLPIHCKRVEERTFALIAIPRRLTQELFGVILELLNSRPLRTNELENEWQRYRDLPFMLFDKNDEYITFVPGVRALFLKKLQIVTARFETDYLRIHQRLYDYFHLRVEESLKNTGRRDKQDLLERSYHALALGDYESVIKLAIYAQQRELDLWEDLLKVIAEAPMRRNLYATVKQEAAEALYRGMRADNTQGAPITVGTRSQSVSTIQIEPLAVRAIVLYTWLLADPGSERKNVGSLWNELGMAYDLLQGVRLDTITRCYQHANAVLDPPTPVTQPLRLIPTPIVSSNQQNSQPPIRNTNRSLLGNRKVWIFLSVILLGVVLLPLVTVGLLQQSQHPTNSDTGNPFAIPLAELKPSPANQWIGTIVEPDQEFVGLSNGVVPFDYLRPDGMLKAQAAYEWHYGHLTQAYALLKQATESDVNDAEAWIYLQNIQILLSKKSCAIFVVTTRIIEDGSEGVNNGRDNLQGAYVWQKEYNDNHPQTPPICLYIANIGSNAGYESDVAKQIVKAVASNGMIKGLIGWPGLFDSQTSLDAVHLLDKANLPIVSPESYDEVQVVSNVFHIAPSRQSQGQRAALYAESLFKRHAAIFTDPTDPYSHSLTEGFRQQFEGDGNKIAALQSYVTGQTDAQTLTVKLKDALATRPDCIYFTGGIGEGSVLLAELRKLSSSLPLLGSEQLYSFVGFSTNPQPGLNHLAFTSAAYPDVVTSATERMTGEYALDFDPNDPNHVRGYGYSRPDSEAILSYDAMETLVTAYTNAAGLQSVLQTLPSIDIQGARGKIIAFSSLNELTDQSLFAVHINQQGQFGSYSI